MGSHSDIKYNYNFSFFYLPEENSDEILDEIINRLTQIFDYDREGEWFAYEIRQSYFNSGVKYSFIAYKRWLWPPNIKDKSRINFQWREKKFAHILLVEYKGMLAVNARNIPKNDAIERKIRKVEQELLKITTVKNNSKFQRLDLTHTRNTDKGIKHKSLEANDLSESMSVLEGLSYKVNSFKVKSYLATDQTETLTVFLNNSKISRSTSQKEFDELISEIKSKIDFFRQPPAEPDKNFLSIFSQSISYERERNNNLVVTGILLNVLPLTEDDEIIITCGEGEEVANKEDIETNFQNIIPLSRDAHDIYKFTGETGDGKKLSIFLGEEYIRLECDYLNSLRVEIEGRESSLLELINQKGLYQIYFEDFSLMYADRCLYKDPGLMINNGYCLEKFKKYEELNEIKSEKGSGYNLSSKEFEEKTLFRFCEDKFNKDGKIMLVDDLGREWADHILIGDDTVTLFASKHANKKFSASAFHTVVSQVEKNINRFFPTDQEFEERKEYWAGNYSLKGETGIRRIRTAGVSADNAIEKWKFAMKNLNFKKEVWIIVDFISIKVLEATFEYLKCKALGTAEGTNAHEQEGVSILWMISSLDAVCRSMNVDLHIACPEEIPKHPEEN